MSSKQFHFLPNYFGPYFCRILSFDAVNVITLNKLVCFALECLFYHRKRMFLKDSSFNIASHCSYFSSSIFANSVNFSVCMCVWAVAYSVCFVIAGQRNKKWKSLYFVLNASEQQLYYFDNQKVSQYYLRGCSLTRSSQPGHP